MWVDTHVHIDVAEFDADRAQVIERARRAEVGRQLVPAIALSGFAKLAQVCRDFDGLLPAYGLHPIYLAEHRDEDLRELGDWLVRERAPAVGECGLDFFVDGLDRERQIRLFRAQLELARDLGRPVVVHARRAVDAVIAEFRRVGRLTGIVHSYSGSVEQARVLSKLGFLVGIGGPVTYPRSTRIHDLVRRLPLEQLLLETDSPDQPLCGRQGQRNEPALLVDVARHVAALRGVDTEVIARATTANFDRLFGHSS